MELVLRSQRHGFEYQLRIREGINEIHFQFCVCVFDDVCCRLARGNVEQFSGTVVLRIICVIASSHCLLQRRSGVDDYVGPGGGRTWVKFRSFHHGQAFRPQRARFEHS